MQHVKSKLFTISVIFMLIFVLIPSSISRSSFKLFDKASKNKFHSDVIYLQTNSTYEYGQQIGKSYKFFYRSIDILEKISSKEKSTSNSIIDKQMELIKKNYPSIFKELNGLSDITKINVRRLIYLQNFLHKTFKHGCTTIAATGIATKNNETFIAQNMDVYGRNLMSFFIRVFFSKIWIIKINSEKYSYASLGIPILYEKPLLNEKGLGLAGNDIATKGKIRPVDRGPGVPIGIWYPSVMRNCKNVTEVIPYYKGELKPSTENLFSNDVWCDSEGNILMVEMTYNHLALVYGNSTDITKSAEGILWHANHHQWLNPNETGSIYPDEAPTSKYRAKRAEELLIQNHGNITVETFKEICRDHGGGFKPDKPDSWDICCHSDIRYLGFTIKSFIIEPKKLAIHLVNGKPCQNEFIKHNLSNDFN